jgi:hypothetical protein
MRRFRFTVAGLIAVILLLAIGMAALRNPTELWASAVFTAAVSLFASSAVGAMAHRGVRRFTCAGLAIFGWVYLVFSFGSWMGNSVGTPPLLPSCLLDYLQDHIVSDGKTPYTADVEYNTFHSKTSVFRLTTPPSEPSTSTRQFAPSTAAGWRRVNMTAYKQTGHSLGAMLFGILGAFAGRFFAARRERSADPG